MAGSLNTPVSQSRAAKHSPALVKPPSVLQMGVFFGLIIIMLIGMASAQIYLAMVATHVPKTIPVYKGSYYHAS